MPNIIVKEGGYVDDSNIENAFYLTLVMKKRCSYCAATIISTDDVTPNIDGVLIVVDEKSRDGVTTQFHRRILHVLLPNLIKNSSFSIQLGDYDKYNNGKNPRWNYEYKETTIIELYSDIEANPEYAGKKNLWEMFVVDEILYIYLNHKLVKVYRNVSANSPNVANFAFNDLIPNADRAEVENCKVVDFCIGTQKNTYDMFTSLYNAKKYLL